MTAVAIIIAISFVAGVVGLALAFLGRDDAPPQHDAPPTVDSGWRAFS